jgi:hypothetical protein
LIDWPNRPVPRPDKAANLIAGVANVWMIAPLVGYALALFLCAFGRLPGTRLADPAEK